MKHWDMPMEQAIRWWDTVDQKGNSLAGVRALCLVDRFYLLVKVCKRTDMLHPWIYARCREVERDPDDHLDLWAREHYKSTIITFGGIIQEILRDPEITCCIFSHTGDIALKFLLQIKNELQTNETLKAAFPDVLYDNPEKDATRWTQYGIIVRRKSNPKEPTLESSGLVDGQPISAHYKLRVYDDVVTDKSVTTPEQVEKTTNAYSLSQSLGMVGGREWGVGTRYSYTDSYQWIIERGALRPRLYPATDTGQPDGAPVLFPVKDWEDRKRKNTDSDIACQYMQNPLAGTQKMFDASYLQYYEVRPEVLSVYVMCDPARSKKKDSDRTAIIVVGVDYAMNKYLLDGFNHKMDLKERWTFFSRMYIKWKQAPGVQQVRMGYEKFGAEADLDYFEEQMRRRDQPRFEITLLEWPRDTGGSKNDRVQRLTPDLKSRKIFLPYEHDKEALRQVMQGRDAKPALTKLQKRMEDTGYSYRVAKPILRLDEHGQAYNVTEHVITQFQFFPFGKKDAIDAFSRVYDMEPRAPSVSEPSYAEPEFT
jgi:hypothetical protein